MQPAHATKAPYLGRVKDGARMGPRPILSVKLSLPPSARPHRHRLAPRLRVHAGRRVGKNSNRRRDHKSNCHSILR